MTHMEGQNSNIGIWEQIYSQSDNTQNYPDETLVRVVHRLLSPKTHRTILDYGFGSGSNMIHLINKGYELSGVEVSKSAITKLEERLKRIGQKAQLQLSTDGKLPFEDNKFDVVIAWLVLYYNDWDGFYKAMDEINRVLKPGGVFLGTMCSVGDYSHTHSVALGDGMFRSTVVGQEGATLLVLEEAELQKCFPGRQITKGQFSFQFGERHAKHWVVSYEK